MSLASHLMRALATALAAVLAAGAAHAQLVRIGPPIAADFLPNLIAVSLKAMRDFKEEAGRFESQIQLRRTAFFMASPAQRDKAGIEFDEYLRGKDINYALFTLVGGQNSTTAAQYKFMTMLNGNRELDGGIPKLAKPAFGAWVNGMRRSLGARDDTQILILTDESQLAKAWADNAALYEAYRAERDKGEFYRWQADHRDVKAPFVSLPLRTGLNGGPPPAFFRQRTYSPVFQAELAKAQQDGSSMVRCEYGPRFNREGEEVYNEYLFWRQDLPKNIGMLLQSGIGDDIQLVLDHVIVDCPDLESDAKKAHDLPQVVFASQADRDAVEQAKRELSGQTAKGAGGRSRPPPPPTRPAMPPARPAMSDVTAARQACHAQYQVERRSDPAGAQGRMRECLQAAMLR